MTHPVSTYEGLNAEAIVKTAHIAQTRAGDWQVLVAVNGSLLAARVFFSDRYPRQSLIALGGKTPKVVMYAEPGCVLRISYLEDAISNAAHARN